MIVNTIVIIMQLFIVYLQYRNFVTYHKTNGANRTRVIMLLCTLLLVIHSVNHFTYRPMWTLLIYSTLVIQLYEGYKFIWDYLKTLKLIKWVLNRLTTNSER